MEILFKGRRVDNGVWVEGFYSQFHNRPTIDKPNSHQIFELIDKGVKLFGSSIGGYWHIVDPETICQYTGKNDRKGKRIFSNDIVRSFGEGDFASLFEDFIVKWDEDKCRYIAIDERGRTEEFDTFFAEHCEVTFNLHNPTKIMLGDKILVDLTTDEKLMALIEKYKPKEGES